MDATEEQPPKTPLWKRQEFWIAILLIVVLIAVYLTLNSTAAASNPNAIKGLPQMVGGC